MKIDIFEKFFLIMSGIVLFLCVIYCVYVEGEKECVEFYKENHYILNACKVYKDKLENID